VLLIKENNHHFTRGHPIKRRTIHVGKVIDLGIEIASLPTGGDCELEIIRHPGGAVALALNSDNEVCLLRQYRYATGGWLWELPGGRLEQGESALESAQRELREEAGLEAGKWQTFTEIWSTPGFCDEKLYLYLARDLKSVESCRDEDEVIEVHWLPLGEAIRMCDNNDISDAKTMIGLYRLQREISGT